MRTRNFIVAIVGSVLMVFGATSNAWVVEENFDNGTVGADCGTFWADKADSTVSADKSSSGSKSCKFAIGSGQNTWGGGAAYASPIKKGGEVWVRFRLFIPQGFDFNAYSAGNHLKFLRMTQRDASGNGSGKLDWYWAREGSSDPFRLILENDANCGQECWQLFGGGNGPARGRWETYEQYVKFDHTAADNGGQGIVRTWKNGKLVGTLTRRATMPPGATQIVSAMIFSYWNGGSPQAQHLFFDDLIITNVTPGAKDSAGNSYIGTGNFNFVSPPLPPANVQ